jgi:hypothetical protein
MTNEQLSFPSHHLLSSFPVFQFLPISTTISFAVVSNVFCVLSWVLMFRDRDRELSGLSG